MNTRSRIVAGGLAALMLSTAAVVPLSAEPLSGAPAPVKVAVESFAPDVAADRIDVRKMGPGYEATFRRSGVTYELTLKPDGTLANIGEEVLYSPQPVSPRNDAIGDLTSMTEDLAEFAMAGDRARIEDALGGYRDGLGEVRAMLDDPSGALLAEQLGAMEAALGKGDFAGIALAATDSFKTLEQALDPNALVVPLEVSMLDYVGFRLQSLASYPSPDWAAMTAVADEANGYWNALVLRVGNKGLRDLMTSVQAGLDGSVAARDLDQLRFAAQMELDAVDLLEGHFDAAWKTGAGAATEPANADRTNATPQTADDPSSDGSSHTDPTSL